MLLCLGVGVGGAGTLSYLINFTFLTEAQGTFFVVYKKKNLRPLIRDLIRFPSVGSPLKLSCDLQQLLPPIKSLFRL